MQRGPRRAAGGGVVPGARPDRSATALPAALADRLAGLLAGRPPEPGAAALRVAVDGPELPARPEHGLALAAELAARLPGLGRPAVVVPAEGFYRPASLRLEHGRTDPDARYTDWLDAGALAREVLDPLRSAAGPASYLPVLWDLERDRAARLGYRPMPPGRRAAGARVAAAGARAGVRRRRPPAGRPRRPAGAGCPADRAWELPAFDRYDDEVDPTALADAVVLADHPDRPALVLQGSFS